jgi:hypothetical protein
MDIIRERKMKNRTPIQAADLYVLLQREFRRRQAPECSTCFVQLPFRVDRAGVDAPNWEVIFPAECRYGCREVMDHVIEDFSRRYELLSEEVS